MYGRAHRWREEPLINHAKICKNIQYYRSNNKWCSSCMEGLTNGATSLLINNKKKTKKKLI
jgi:tRNA A37 threonylcarbamoyladenosine synthetase subunit TsaC/SUA5/YrdC